MKERHGRMDRICMVVFSHYPNDPRVRREAEALFDAGMSVDIICLGEKGEPKKENVHGIETHRIRLKHKRKGKLRYLYEYVYFITRAFFKVSWLHLKRRYRIVHVHNMPDVLVFCAVFPKLTGSRLILDLHDPMPELFMAMYRSNESGLLIRGLVFLERLSIQMADLVLTPNKSFRDLFISRSSPSWKTHIVMNSPQEDIFVNTHQARNGDKASLEDPFVLMYHGLIVERHGIDTALEAVDRIREKIPHLIFHIYGKGEYLPAAKKMAEERNLADIVFFHGNVPLEEIASALSKIDAGIIPNKLNAFTNINMPTRVFECLSMGKLVIAPRTQGIKDYFEEDAIYYFESENVDDLERVILDVYFDPVKRRRVLKRGIDVYQKHCWATQKKQLIELVGRLLDSSNIQASFDRRSGDQET